MESRRLLASAVAAAAAAPVAPLVAADDTALPPRQMENLDRGLVAVRASSTQAFLSWRLLGLEPANVGFNVYRSANGAAPVKLNGSVLTAGTNFTDTTANFSLSNSYTVRAIINNVEQPASRAFTLAANTPVALYRSIALEAPVGEPTPDAVPYTYAPNDASVADLDGDGAYEIILKWDPSNAKDNSQSGYTGNVFIDAYKLNDNGTSARLWRIDLGRNIRAGAHYTQFIAYDLDGDGKAEVAMKTAPGTKDGAGNNVLLGGDDPNADYRTAGGYVLSGPEYLTVFNGQTGAAMATTNFLVARGSVSNWGDSYGNRVDRFLAGVAYLDGRRPSLIMGRGYYERTTISAWNFRSGQLTQAWNQPFDSEDATPDPAYEGQGAHSLSIADVDADGRDEIIYGAATIDDNGQPLAVSGLGHGDALHASDMDPSRPGIEVFQVHEGTGSNGHIGASLRDGATGEVLVALPVTQNTDGSWPDVGRGVAMDIDPSPGYEFWTSSHPSIYAIDGTPLYGRGNAFINFGAWWDGDLYRELLDGTTISNWNLPGGGRSNIDLDPASSSTYPPGTSSNNGTKSTPALSADIYGDWREEVIWRTSDNTELRIFTTPIATSTRLVTLMHDSMYRVAIAWQNGAYNQPPHPSFFLGNGMATPPAPNMYYAPGTLPGAPSALSATPTSPTQVNLSWTGASGATSYIVKRGTSSTGPFTTIASGISTTTYADTAAVSGATYFYVVTGDNGVGEGPQSNVASANVPLPAPWTAADIGAVTMAGGTTVASGVWNSSAAGADIWGTADQFRFTHQAASGDFAVVARVTALTNTNSWAKAGVMIRDGTAANAMHAMVVQTPTTNGVAFQYRTATGGASAGPNVANVPVGSWVKLTRTSNLFSASYSTDGTTWLAIGTPVTINMPANVRAGLAVTSHNTAALATATFNNVAVTPIVTGSVAGKIFHDTNADNVAAAGDPPLAGVTVYLDANGNSALDAGERETMSAPDGAYAFGSVIPGSYTVRTLAPSDFVSAGDPPVVVSGGGSSNADVPHARIVYRGTGGNDQYLVRRNLSGPLEILIGGALAYTVFGGVPSLTFNLLGGDDTLTLDFAGGIPHPFGGVQFNGGDGADELSIALTEEAAEYVEFNASYVGMVGVIGAMAHAETESVRFDGNGGWHTVVVNAGPRVTFPDAQRLQALALNGTAAARFAVGAGTSVTRWLEVAAAARLDIADSTLVVNTNDPAAAGAWNGSAYTGYQGLVTRGYNFSAWDGPGIVTTRPQALLGVTTVGVATAEQMLFIGPSQTAVYDGQTVTGRSVILKYTYAGDLNLDGVIDGADYGTIDNSVQFPGTDGYANGDFNFDGVIDGADYGIIDNSMQLQGTPL